MGVLGGRKETKEVSDILEVADGDCLDRLMRARVGASNSKVMHLRVGNLGKCRKGRLGWPWGPMVHRAKGSPL